MTVRKDRFKTMIDRWWAAEDYPWQKDKRGREYIDMPFKRTRLISFILCMGLCPFAIATAEARMLWIAIPLVVITYAAMITLAVAAVVGYLLIFPRLWRD